MAEFGSAELVASMFTTSNVYSAVFVEAAVCIPLNVNAATDPSEALAKRPTRPTTADTVGVEEATTTGEGLNVGAVTVGGAVVSGITVGAGGVSVRPTTQAARVIARKPKNAARSGDDASRIMMIL